MKISNRTRYGVMLLIDLAERREEGLVTLSSTAERRGISVRYLEHVAIILRHDGFIRSVKGAQGGYALCREPAGILLGDVLRSLEGDMFVVDPLIPGEEEGALDAAVRRAVFDVLNIEIKKIIDNKTLAELTGTSDCGGEYMYFI